MNSIILLYTSSCARSSRFAEACCDHLVFTHLKYKILCCGVVYDCSHTADMHDVAMMGVTCYRDVSEHDQVLQWEQWCPYPRWKAARCVQLDDFIQVWRPVVESAWCELSSSPQEGWELSLPASGPVSSSTPPHQGVNLTPGGSLYMVQSDSSINIFSHDFLL